MPSTISSKLNRLDRRLFATLEHARARKPAELSAMLSSLGEYSRTEISESLTRLLCRGLIAELPGRRFFAPLIASDPQSFNPLTDAEWVQAGA